MGNLIGQVEKCGKFDVGKRDTWTNVTKYCGTGNTLAKELAKTQEKYAATKEPEKLRELEKLYERQVEETTDVMNKIVAAANPLIGG